MEDIKFRHELKYEISWEDYYILRSRLRALMKTDPHAEPEGHYKIRSLYFETPDDKALREKLTGVCKREKFRIRYYNDDYSFIRLEKKYKENNMGMKLSAPITKEECLLLLAGDISWMKDANENQLFPQEQKPTPEEFQIPEQLHATKQSQTPEQSQKPGTNQIQTRQQGQHALKLELYGKMKNERLAPKVIVDYMREPYIFKAGNVRVTLDTHIKTAVHSLDFFNPQLPTIGVLAKNPIVMEVKYDAFLPEVVREIIQTGNRRAGAFSKYGYSRMFG